MNRIAADQLVRGALYQCLHDSKAYVFSGEHIVSGQILVQLNEIIKNTTGVDMSTRLDMSDSGASISIGEYVEVFGTGFLEREIAQGVVKK